MATAPSTRRLLRLHLALVACVCLCVSAFVIEVLRALGGNTLSWAYVFEWPILLCYGIYLWLRLVREERAGGPTADWPARRAAAAPDPRAEVDAEADADREAYNAYLAELHAADAAAGRGRRLPPGGSTAP